MAVKATLAKSAEQMRQCTPSKANQLLRTFTGAERAESVRSKVEPPRGLPRGAQGAYEVAFLRPKDDFDCVFLQNSIVKSEKFH